MLLHIRLRHRSNLSDFSLYIRLSAVSTEPQCKQIRTLIAKMPPSQRSRDFLLPQGQPASNHVLLFSDLLAQRKSLSEKNNGIIAKSLSCNLLSQLIDNSATKGRFFFADRKLSYSSLSRCSSVLAANDCRFQVKSFLQRSSSFSLASASRVQRDNESWHARQRAYLRNTYNLNSYNSGTRAWVDVHAKKKPYQTQTQTQIHIFQQDCRKVT